MPSTGTAAARVSTAGASIYSAHGSVAAKPEVPARVREGARWFFWIVGLIFADSVLVTLGSGLHRFTGLGMTTLMDGLGKAGSSATLHVIVNGWVATAFLFLGYCAAEGHRSAFIIGLTAYAVDGAILVGSNDYLSVVLHAFILVAIFRGFAAVSRGLNSEPSGAAANAV
jgi:hypothetical protein